MKLIITPHVVYNILREDAAASETAFMGIDTADVIRMISSYPQAVLMRFSGYVDLSSLLYAVHASAARFIVGAEEYGCLYFLFADGLDVDDMSLLQGDRLPGCSRMQRSMLSRDAFKESSSRKDDLAADVCLFFPKDRSRTVEEIQSFFAENLYGHYAAADDKLIQSEVWDKFSSALLHSLSDGELIILRDKMQEDGNCPGRLSYKTSAILDRRMNADIKTSTLLRLYSNKDSKRVSFAAKELKRRYPMLSQEKQRSVLRGFLMGGKNERTWAARRLRWQWIEAMGPLVARRWEETHEELLAYLVLRYLPAKYVMAQQDQLADVVDYSYVCARLGNEPGFVMDESRLSVPEYFYAVAKSGFPVNRAALQARLDAYLNSDNVREDQTGLLLWAMGQLHMTEPLIHLGGQLLEK